MTARRHGNYQLPLGDISGVGVLWEKIDKKSSFFFLRCLCITGSAKIADVKSSQHQQMAQLILFPPLH